MDADDLARRLIYDSRREWQDPAKIAKEIGIVKGIWVADLGCGPGFFTLPIASMVGENGVVYAVDANPIMLRHLRTNLQSGRCNHGIEVGVPPGGTLRELSGAGKDDRKQRKDSGSWNHSGEFGVQGGSCFPRNAVGLEFQVEFQQGGGWDDGVNDSHVRNQLSAYYAKTP